MDPITRARIWLRRHAELVAFLAEHGGRRPLAGSSDTVERSLGRWLDRQRWAMADLDCLQQHMLDRVIPIWRVSFNDAKWLSFAARAQEFYDTHGRYPDWRDDPELATWIENEKFRVNRDARPDRNAVLDQQAPGLLSGAAESRWLLNATNIGEWSTKNDGRLPSRKAEEPVERGLGLWLHNQRMRLSDTNPKHRGRIKTLDTMVPGWRGSKAAAAAA